MSSTSSIKSSFAQQEAQNNAQTRAKKSRQITKFTQRQKVDEFISRNEINKNQRTDTYTKKLLN